MASLTLLGDDGEPINFPLFKKEGETNENFLYRIFGLAEVWCPLVNEAQIPVSGYVRDVWTNYIGIRLMSYDELYDTLYDVEGDRMIRSQEIEGVFARTSLSLLRLEARRRRETSE
jgi:hypothetical protein